MIKLKSITMKNFMSVGNSPQTILLDSHPLTLVLGDNKDIDSQSMTSRNGVGKSTCTHAISYNLYGQALANIKRDFLINRTNAKNMIVITEFEKNGNNYRIERGRKPSILKVFVDNTEQTFVDDEAQGDNRETQKWIDELIGMNHLMFKNIVMLNTYSDSFLAMKTADQREVIENLLGITILSEKADKLKDQIRITKDGITKENATIAAISQANINIQNTIQTLKSRQKSWVANRDDECVKLYTKIEQLKNIDIDSELRNHQLLTDYTKQYQQLELLKKDKSRIERELQSQHNLHIQHTKNLEQLKNNVCPACEQSITDHKHETMIQNAQGLLTKCDNTMNDLAAQLTAILGEIEGIVLIDKPIVYYSNINDAVTHQNTLLNLENSLQSKALENDPYQEQIDTMESTALQTIDYDTLDDLTKIKNHQDFLLKLLTNKDSFIRKKIVEQNLSFLNGRLEYYLSKIGLIHKVTFLNDLSVEITYMGHDLDYHNLSRGEMTRVTLALSWAFRDVWENLYYSINLLFIDELMDNGMDSIGAENTLVILKTMTGKNIFLISHKEELATKVNNVMMVVKENGFSNYYLD